MLFGVYAAALIFGIKKYFGIFVLIVIQFLNM